MRLIVSNIPDSGLEEELKMSVTLQDNTAKCDAHGFLKIFKTKDTVLINGKVEGEASLICSRCLKEFPYPVSVKFDLKYIPFREFTWVDEHELTEKELDLSFYKDDEIDTGELIQEQLLLAIPMKPLCNPDCYGICPKCGKNLNEGLCRCGIEETDPRLAPLKKFRESLKKSNA